MNEIILTAENFEKEVMNTDKPVMIDFWASWCGPCRMLGPVISEIAEEYSDKAKICKVNVDEQQALAAKFNIASIPTVVVMKNGKLVKTSVGVKPKRQLVDMLG